MCDVNHKHHGHHHGHGHHRHHEEHCGCGEHEIHCECETDVECGCEDKSAETDCCCGHHGFKRRFITKEEIIAELEAYKELLQKEIKGVEEEIAEIKK